MKNELQRKILIITGGNVSKLDGFKEAAEKLKTNVTLASFADINYGYKNVDDFMLKVGNNDISSFDIIYIRMIGKRLEDASLLVQYANSHAIKIVDRLYKTELLYPSSISKAVETKKLIEAGIPMPVTFYGSLEYVIKKAKEELEFPFIIKSTSGRKAREVWLVESEEDLRVKKQMLADLEKNGMRFFSQAYIATSQRVRVMVLDGSAIAAITRPTKWRGRIESKLTKANPKGIRGKIDPIPSVYKNISESAAKAAGLDICGVDILHEDDTRNIYVIEANAAPAWKLIRKDWGIVMEEEILKWLAKI